MNASSPPPPPSDDVTVTDGHLHVSKNMLHEPPKFSFKQNMRVVWLIKFTKDNMSVITAPFFFGALFLPRPFWQQCSCGNCIVNMLLDLPAKGMPMI